MITEVPRARANDRQSRATACVVPRPQPDQRTPFTIRGLLITDAPMRCPLAASRRRGDARAHRNAPAPTLKDVQ